MWNYEKRLQYPVNIKETNPTLAMAIATQYGGPDCNIDGYATNPVKSRVVAIFHS